MADLSVDLQANRVRIVPDEGSAFSLSMIPHAIRNAGFRPGEMTITARGSIVEAVEGSAFRIAGWPSPIPIEGRTPDGGARQIRARYHWEKNPPKLEILDA